jgi:small-conductance mechanosensitive channel
MMRFLIFIWLLLAAGGTVAAQSLTGPAASAGPANQSGIRQEGAYLTAPITLDGQQLFRIAAPASPQSGQVPVAQRQLDVENALSQLVAVVAVGDRTTPLYRPKTFRVTYEASGDQVVLQATDQAHPAPVTIVTVTPIDAKYYGETVTTVAKQWQPILQSDLKRALLKRLPGVERRNLRSVGIAGAALALFTLLIWVVVVGAISGRLTRIERRIADRGEELERVRSGSTQNSNGQHRWRFLVAAIRLGDPYYQHGMLRAVSATIVWALVVLWFGWLVWGFQQFPQTTPLANRIQQIVIFVIATWILTGLVNRLLDLAISRVAGLIKRRQYGSPDDRARQLLRIPTATVAISSFKAFVLFFVALLVTLGEVGIPVWSVVTFGGLTAIGITLAAQNFVRDFVNGSLVLMEDQYVVGDYVSINAFSGIVEALTLRIVQLRDAGGNLITVPHSTVTSVVNHSRNWSRVDYRISIDPEADVPKAIDAISEAIQEVSREESLRDVVLEAIEWIGVDGLSRDGVIVRASIKTAPLRQFEVRRAINARVLDRLAQRGIKLGAPIPESA